VSTGTGSLAVDLRPPIAASPAPAPWPYLLVHGSMDRATSFRRLQARLPEAIIISYDRRGYAGSGSRPTTETFADQVADLFEVLDGRPVVALGHSFGGGVVLAAAALHPELIRAAVIWEPPMPWLASWQAGSAGAAAISSGDDPADVAESFMRRMIGSHIWERLPPATREARRGDGPALITEIRSLRDSAAWDPAAVTIPVIVGSGGKSRDHQRQAAAELARVLPDAELAVLADSGHGAHLSHPGPLADLLRRAMALATTRAGVGRHDEAALGVGRGDGAAASSKFPPSPTRIELT
jgi:pimeloyl-ACP methyl ester carboxylesterase